MFRLPLARPLVHHGTRREDCDVLSVVTLGRRHVADAAVTVLVAVPGDEVGDSGAGLLERDEGLARVAGPVPERAEERL